MDCGFGTATIDWVGCRGVAQPGRALGSGPRGRWFESTRPDQLSSGDFVPGPLTRSLVRLGSPEKHSAKSVVSTCKTLVLVALIGAATAAEEQVQPELARRYFEE